MSMMKISNLLLEELSVFGQQQVLLLLVHQWPMFFVNCLSILKMTEVLIDCSSIMEMVKGVFVACSLFPEMANGFLSIVHQYWK